MSALPAIGTVATAKPQSGSAGAAIRAQIARFEKQRSDCVNCSSAKTTEGQQNIRNLDSQIHSLKTQLLKVQQPASAQRVEGDRSSAARVTAGRIDVYA